MREFYMQLAAIFSTLELHRLYDFVVSTVNEKKKISVYLRSDTPRSIYLSNHGGPKHHRTVAIILG